MGHADVPAYDDGLDGQIEVAVGEVDGLAYGGEIGDVGHVEAVESELFCHVGGAEQHYSFYMGVFLF